MIEKHFLPICAVLGTFALGFMTHIIGKYPHLSAMLGGWFSIAILMSIYFVPAIVAGFRNHRNTAAIVILNLLLGWTVLGWIAALVWSATNPASAKAI